MNPFNDLKFVSVTPPAAIVDNAAFTTGEIDTFDATLGKATYCNIVIYVGATDIAAAVCKVQESDTSGSGFADISGSDLASSFVDTIDNTAVVYTIDLRNPARKRYIDVLLTAGNGSAGTYAAISAFLVFEKQPTSNTERNWSLSAAL